MITGTTTHKLDIISTYSKTQPFQIGINGVTNITYRETDPTKIDKIYYTIGDIDYVTTYITPTENPNNIHPTTFKTNVSGYDFQGYSLIKEEAKMGMVFPPKVEDDVFIERMSIAVFERQSRLSNIKSLDDLIEYRNGYYNIVENN